MAAWLGAALTGLGALGGLFGKKATNEGKVDKTTTPVYDDHNQYFKDFLIDQFINRQKEDQGGFQDAYTKLGLGNILKTSQAALGNVDNILTSRGLGRSMAGASALRDASIYQGGKIADFLNSVPLTMRDMRSADLAQAAGYQSSLPIGQHVIGTDTTQQSQGGGLGGSLGGAASTLAGYLGQWSAQKSFSDTLKALGR